MTDRMEFASVASIAAVKSKTTCCNIRVGENEDAL